MLLIKTSEYFDLAFVFTTMMVLRIVTRQVRYQDKYNTEFKERLIERMR